MQKSKIGTLLSLLLAPALLLTINLFDLESESYSYMVLRLVPAAISSLFFLFFLNAYLNKKNLILSFTKKFYHKELSPQELEFLSHGDLYWVGVTLLNTVIQAFMGIFANDIIWVFYSSIGWYVYFLIALFGQIIYGKWYNKTKEGSV